MDCLFNLNGGNLKCRRAKGKKPVERRKKCGPSFLFLRIDVPLTDKLKPMASIVMDIMQCRGFFC